MKVSDRIIGSLEETLAWVNGDGKAFVYLPTGEKAEMTFEEYVMWMRRHLEGQSQ